ncbi:MAG: efflux RND transporter periplasmic adaptor subunit, partial [Methylosarcina sp.]
MKKNTCGPAVVHGQSPNTAPFISTVNDHSIFPKLPGHRTWVAGLATIALAVASGCKNNADSADQPPQGPPPAVKIA